MFKALFRKSLLTPLETSLTGDSAFGGLTGGRLLLSDFLDFNGLFLIESLLVRLFLLSVLVRFFMELLLTREGDFETTEGDDSVLFDVSPPPPGDSVLLLLIGELFFESFDEGVETALEDNGLNLEYFVESSIRSD